METIIQTSVVSINNPKLYAEVDRNNSVLLYQWKGHIMDDEAKEGFLSLTKLIKEHNLVNLLADITKFKGGTIATAKWVNTQWSEMVKEAGIKKVGVLVPESAFGEFSNQVALGEKFVSLLEVEKFNDISDAYAWFGQ